MQQKARGLHNGEINVLKKENDDLKESVTNLATGSRQSAAAPTAPQMNETELKAEIGRLEKDKKDIMKRKGKRKKTLEAMINAHDAQIEECTDESENGSDGGAISE